MGTDLLYLLELNFHKIHREGIFNSMGKIASIPSTYKGVAQLRCKWKFNSLAMRSEVSHANLYLSIDLQNLLNVLLVASADPLFFVRYDA